MLGRKAPFSQVQKALGGLSHEERRDVGLLANEARAALTAALEARREVLHLQAEGALLEADRVDLSLPGRRPPAGSLHPLTIVEREIVGVFMSLGLPRGRRPRDRGRLAQLPGAEHPARPPRAYDEGLAVRRRCPGIPSCCCGPRRAPSRSARCSRSRRPSTWSAPGRVYRRETPDATHSPVFHQVEGLAVDEGITFADLKGTLEARGQVPVRRTPAGPARPGVLPVRGAGLRGGRLVLQVRRRRVPGLRQRVDRAARCRDGASAGPRELRLRQRAVHGVRLRDGDRPRGDPEVRRSPTCGCSSTATCGSSRNSRASHEDRPLVAPGVLPHRPGSPTSSPS